MPEENGMGEPFHDVSKAMERQIRRHVTGPDHRFLAVAPPELIPLCLDELLALGFPSAERTPAGVEFTGKLRMGYAANLWLRTASRILCRIARFRAGAVEELFKHCLAMRWELWLPPGIPLSVESHVARSRIEHEGAVVRTVYRAIQRRLDSLGMQAPPQLKSDDAALSGEASSDPLKRQRLLVHLEDNACEVSLDMTGGHLHQRGYRLEHAGAPLRETLAAAILMRSGWVGHTPLVDGMCGSGTFAIEACLMARRIPPAAGRSFLFQRWPSFEDRTWDYLRRKALEQAAPQMTAPVLGVDRDPRSLEISLANAARAGVERDIQWALDDFFEWDPGRLGLKGGTVLLNPPYGRRLKEAPQKTYEQAGAHLRKAFRGWRAVVLAPDRESAAKLRLPSARYWKILHGGSPVTVVIGDVN
ncbi:MAG: hypothetical protein MUC41_02530 [Syntrophobacteraceae bacterium]|nr:hypothetical protein [Syntrophobacteraceae bacterium]